MNLLTRGKVSSESGPIQQFKSPYLRVLRWNAWVLCWALLVPSRIPLSLVKSPSNRWESSGWWCRGWHPPALNLGEANMLMTFDGWGHLNIHKNVALELGYILEECILVSAIATKQFFMARNGISLGIQVHHSFPLIRKTDFEGIRLHLKVKFWTYQIRMVVRYTHLFSVRVWVVGFNRISNSYRIWITLLSLRGFLSKAFNERLFCLSFFSARSINFEVCDFENLIISASCLGLFWPPLFSLKCYFDRICIIFLFIFLQLKFFDHSPQGYCELELWKNWINSCDEITSAVYFQSRICWVGLYNKALRPFFKSGRN